MAETPPKVIYITDHDMRQMRFHGLVCIDPVTDADRYHHDAVVQELAALLLLAEKAMPADLRTHRGLRDRISAALANLD